jgi:hypothetical protein
LGTGDGGAALSERRFIIDIGLVLLGGAAAGTVESTLAVWEWPPLLRGGSRWTIGDRTSTIVDDAGGACEDMYGNGGDA